MNKQLLRAKLKFEMIKRNPRISVESLQRLPAGNACTALVVEKVSSVDSSISYRMPRPIACPGSWTSQTLSRRVD